MRQLVCLSNEPWSKRPSRTQRFLQNLPDTEILYFEPSLSLDGTSNSVLEEKVCQRVAPLTYVYTLPALKPVLEDRSLRHTLNHRKLAKFIYSCMEYHQFKEILLWVCSPMYSDLLNALPYSALVYDCDQDWDLLPILWESTLTSRADLVLAASPGLADHLSPCNDHIVVVPNGFSYARYAPEQLAKLPCPTDLAQIREPVFGYAGTVWPNLNLRPIYNAVRAHPEWHFVIVGKCSKKNRYLKALRTYPNFHLLGPKSPAELPAYISHFTVGTAFLREDMEDNDILSPRIYEYMATGIPIVAMYHHLHKEEYPQLIESAYSEKQFVAMCEKVLTEDTLLRRARRTFEAEQADWSHRCHQVQQLVLEGHLLGD